MRIATLLVTLLSLACSEAHADEPRPTQAPSDGRALIVSGAILTALGGAMVVGSVGLWATGARKDPMGAALAASIDTFGGALLMPGVVLLPVGIVRRTRHARWLAETRVAAAPTIADGARGARVSLAVSF